MTRTTVAVVGTGRDGIADAHARAYGAIEDCELVACADLIEENAAHYAEKFNIADDLVFTEYEAMLRAVEPDLVSVCTPEATHAEVVVGCARSGIPDGVHCEKVMDATWGGCRRMVQVCEAEGVALTVNHQRRFGDPWQDAKAAIDAGAIGEVRRVSFSFADLFTYGPHSLDLCGLFAGDRPAEWVLGQIDYAEENTWRGLHVENGALASWEYDNGVQGLASLGRGAGLVNAHNRVEGTEGSLEVRKRFDEGGLRDHALVVEPNGEESELTAYDETNDWIPAFRDVVESLRDGHESALAAENALRSTEILFAIYESARRRGRVDLPLRIEDNPLQSMVASGAIEPAAAKSSE